MTIRADCRDRFKFLASIELRQFDRLGCLQAQSRQNQPKSAVATGLACGIAALAKRTCGNRTELIASSLYSALNFLYQPLEGPSFERRVE